MVSADIDNVNGSSLVTESYNEWTSKPVISNVQVDLENEGDQDYVYSILDEVEKQGYTTVFVTGEFASLYPDVVKEIEGRGQDIAVHGWRKGENLTLLNYEEQLNLIQKSFSAVRSAVNNPEEVVDFKPQGYKFNNDTIRILQQLGVRSIGGIFSCQEPLCKCPYAQELGKITFPYPVTDKFWLVPISEINDTVLDDEYIGNPQEFFNALIEKFNLANETKDPLIIVIHPSITGADEAKLNAFSQFLDYVKSNNGRIKPLSSITHLTEFIPSLEIISAPQSASQGETVTITVQFTAAIYCPSYYFRIYGKYPSEKEWRLHAEHYHGVQTGTFSFSRSFAIPERTFTDEDVEWLAKAIMSEAGGESQHEQIAVGHTVLNRLATSRFGENIKQIVERGYAYHKQPTGVIIKLAKELLQGQYQDPTGGATHFFSPKSMTSGYGPYKIPGTDKEAYIPSWAIPEGYSKELPPPAGWEMPNEPYRTIDSPMFAAEWVGSLENIDNWNFMFYRPTSKYRPAPYDRYIVRVVGQGCAGTCWPTPYTYEKKDEVEIKIGIKPTLVPTKLQKVIQQEAKETRVITVDGEEYYIVTLKRYIDPETWEPSDYSFFAEEPPAWIVYTYPNFQPISDKEDEELKELLRKIWTVDRANILLKRIGSPESISVSIRVIDDVISASEGLSEARYGERWARSGVFNILDLVFAAETGARIIDLGIGTIIEQQLEYYYADLTTFMLEGGRALLDASKEDYQKAREIAEAHRDGISDYTTAKDYLNYYYNGYFKFLYGVEMALPTEEITKSAFLDIANWIPEYIKHLALKIALSPLGELLSTLGEHTVSVSKVTMEAVNTQEKMRAYINTQLKEIEEKINRLFEYESYPLYSAL
ncbi:MAG: cell wall hydrolase [archaeon]|nr:cell wall hydrolase [archaeon]